MANLPPLNLEPSTRTEKSVESRPLLHSEADPEYQPLFIEQPVSSSNSVSTSNFISTYPILISIIPIIFLYAMALVYLRKSIMYSYEKALWSIIVILFPIIGPIFLLIIQPKTPAAYSNPTKSS